MKQDTKDAIKSGLETGALFGAATSIQSAFMGNAMLGMPFNVLLNVVLPAAVCAFGFSIGYDACKDYRMEQKLKREKEMDLSVDDMLNLLDKAGATTEEKIAILIEQKQLLSENKEEKVDSAKTR